MPTTGTTGVDTAVDSVSQGVDVASVGWTGVVVASVGYTGVELDAGTVTVAVDSVSQGV